MAPSTAVRRIRERVVQASSTSPRGRSTDSAYPSATVVVMTTYGLTTCIAPSTSRNSDGRAPRMRPARSLCLETRTVCVADGTEPLFVYGVRVVPPNAPFGSDSSYAPSDVSLIQSFFTRLARNLLELVGLAGVKGDNDHILPFREELMRNPFAYHVPYIC